MSTTAHTLSAAAGDLDSMVTHGLISSRHNQCITAGQIQKATVYSKIPMPSTKMLRQDNSCRSAGLLVCIQEDKLTNHCRQDARTSPHQQSQPAQESEKVDYLENEAICVQH